MSPYELGRAFTSTVSKKMNNLPRSTLDFHRELSCGLLQYGWFYPTTDSSSGGWIRFAADSFLRLTQVSAAGYELRLILFCD